MGSRIPLATTAMGRAYLALCAQAERDSLMQRIRELDEAAWPRVREGIERALAGYRELGCCSSFGEWQKDVNAIAIARVRARPDGPPQVGWPLGSWPWSGVATKLSRKVK